MLVPYISSRSRIRRIIIYAIVITTILFLSAAGSNVAVLSISDPGSRTASVTVPCTLPPSGLVSWWTGDGHSRDIRGINHGSLQNSPVFSPGPVDSAFNFNGVNQYLYLPQTAGLPVRGTNDFTIEAWINHQGNEGNEVFNVFAYRNGGQDIQFFITRTQIGIWGTSSAGMIVLTNHGVIAANWNHYAFTRSGSTWRVYVNGNQVGGDATNAISLLTPTTPQNIGTTGLANTQFANGMIDEISIYNRSLIQNEIQSIFASGAAGKCRTPPPVPVGLVSWWPGDGTVSDIRSRFDGTLAPHASYATGKVGSAFNLPGTYSSYVEIPDSAAFNPAGAFSVDGWFYLDPAAPGNAGDISTFIGKTEGSLGNGIAIYFDDRSFTRSIKFALGGIVEAPNAIPSANWYHIAGTFDPASIPRAKLYVNGTVAADSGGAVWGVSANSYNFRIGAMHWTDTYGLGNDRLNGKADEVEFFDRALSAEEIQSIVNAGSSGKCKPTAETPPPGMVGWWGGDGDTRDSSTYANNGTLLANGTYSVGKIGQTFAFNGSSNSGVTIPHSSNYDLGPSGFTAEFWMKSNGAQPDLRAGLLEKSHGFVDSTGWAFTTFSDLNNVHFAIGVGGAGNSNFSEIVSTGANMFDGNYHHIAGTWEANTMSLYIDGALQYSVPDVIPANNGRDLNIGYNWGGGTQQRFFNGNIDEVSIYDRSLSLAEIQSIYNAGLAGKLKSGATPANTFAESGRNGVQRGLSNPGIQLGDATVTLPIISTGGATQQIPLDPALLPPLPMGATPTNLTYDIATSAIWSGTPSVCFNLPALSSVYRNLRILHLENGVWVNRTQVSGVNPTLCTYGLTSLSPFTIANFGPTAATVSISGRVMTPNGNGVLNAIVQLTDQQGSMRTTRTSTFGYYRFDDVLVGESCVIGVVSKRFVFVPRTVLIMDEMGDVDLVAESP